MGATTSCCSGKNDAAPAVDLMLEQVNTSPERIEASEQDMKQARDFDVGADGCDHAVYNWLTWAPKPASKCNETLEKCFPGALPGQVVVQRAALALSEFGLTPENTIYGHSICPDEINCEKGGMAHSMAEYWGECFPMGGIGGMPFVGKTGFSAFSHHVPDDGHVLILFGPHIAVSESGELGRVLRFGQEKESGACGAVLAAYDACCKCRSHEFDKSDMQQSWLKQQIAAKIDKIQSDSDPLHALIHETYECVKEKMLGIVNHNFGNGKLVLLGGIQLNMPKPCDDHFAPLMFQVISKDGSKADLMGNFRFKMPWSFANLTYNHQCFSIFSWLGWSPSPTSASFQTLHRCFPDALPGQAIVRKSSTVLGQYGLNPANTIYGQSICPDEINSEKGGLAHSMVEYWGECFPMGGIGGAPFVGKTGFSAFSSHVPDGGHVFIVFGPHIGISESGELGKFLRHGQKKASTACGAVLAAHDACKQGHDHTCEFDERDYEQSWLKSQIGLQMDKIENSTEPLETLIHVAYESVKSKLLSIIHNNFGQGKLVLLGGVQLNMPYPLKDHFEPLYFQIHEMDGSKIDLLNTLTEITLDMGSFSK